MSGPSVLIVGAGPVGLTLACELARRDVDLRIIDRLERATTESRAIVVHARSLEMLRRVGVADEVVAAGRRTTGMVFHAGGRDLARAALDTVESPYPHSVTLAQTETERILTARLASLGVEVDRGRELVGLEQDASGARARVRRAGGDEELVPASWVAGTDGAHSTVRRLAGARLAGSFAGESFLMADAEAEYGLQRNSMHTFFAAGEGPLLVFPMGGDRVRLIAQVADGAGSGAPTLEEMQAVCDRRAGGIRLREAHWLTHFEIHHAQVPDYRLGRVLLAGDAAHVHSPAGGQGMNTGVQDAFNLGWKLTLVITGAASPDLLDSYHAERHPVAARVIRAANTLTRAATLRGDRRRALRNRLLPLVLGVGPVNRRAAAMIEETDIAYRNSSIVAPGERLGRGPQPGDSAPDVAGAVAGRSLHDVLAGHTGHTLVRIGGAAAPPTAFGVPVETVAADGADADAARRYRAGDGAVFVVRPDGYLGARAEAGDGATLERYFAMVRAGRGRRRRGRGWQVSHT